MIITKAAPREAATMPEETGSSIFSLSRTKYKKAGATININRR